MSDLQELYEALEIIRVTRVGHAMGEQLERGIHRDVLRECQRFGGRLECATCGSVRPLKYTMGRYLRHGWPQCCGYTMTWLTDEQLRASRARVADAARRSTFGEWVRYSREEEKQLYCQPCAVREEEGE